MMRGFQIDAIQFEAADARRHLFLFGYFGERDPADVDAIDSYSVEFTDAVENMQRDYGLVDNGIIDPITARAMLAPTCHVGAQARGDARWRKGCGKHDFTELTYHLDPRGVKGISEDRAVDEAQAGAAEWSAASGIHLTWTDDREAANLQCKMNQLGRNILGLAELPFGVDCGARLFCYLQITAVWTPGKKGSFSEVFKHEIGHNLGHEHEDRLKYPSVMTSKALGVYTSPTPFDIAQSQLRYGKNTYDPAGPVDPVDPIPGDFAFGVLTTFDWKGGRLGQFDVTPKGTFQPIL